MDNPWKNIPLKDYESHMRLDSVRQLQVLNQVMKRQFEEHPVSSAMILGVAGGNGLEHIDIKKYKRIYCVDINPMYLKEASQRYNEPIGYRILRISRCLNIWKRFICILIRMSSRSI